MILAVILILAVCISAFFIISEYKHKPGIDSNTEIEVRKNITDGITPQEALKVAEEYLKMPVFIPVSTTGKSLKRIYNEHHIKEVAISTVK